MYLALSVRAWSSAMVCPRRQRREAGGRLVPERFSIGFCSFSFLDLLFPHVELVGRLVETISSDWTYIDFLISENRGLNGHSNPDLCDADAVLHQLSYRPTGS